MDILKLLGVWFVLSFPAALIVAQIFRVTKPFSNLSCPSCGAGVDEIEANNDEFHCMNCGCFFDDPIETTPLLRIQDDEQRTVNLITRDMLHGDE